MTTPNFGWPYPGQDDEADGAGQIQALAEAIDADVQAIADDVAGLAGGGGGGGGSTASATFSAGTTAQSIPNAADTVVAFGTEVDGDPLVTRSTSDAGHKFTLGASRIWAISTTVRYANHGAGGEKAVSLRTTGGVTLAHAGGAAAGIPATYPLSCTRYLASGTEIIVVCYQGTGGSRTLEPNAGAWVHIDFAAIG